MTEGPTTDRSEEARSWKIQFKSGQTQSFTAAKNFNGKLNDGETFINDWKAFIGNGKLPSDHPRSYTFPRPSFTGATHLFLNIDLRQVISISEEFNHRRTPAEK